MKCLVISGTAACNLSIKRIKEKHSAIKKKRLLMVSAFKKVKSNIIKY